MKPVVANPFEDILTELTEIKKAVSVLSVPNPTLEIIDRPELLRRLQISEPTAIRYGKNIIPEIRIGANIRYNWGAVVESLQNKKNDTKRI